MARERVVRTGEGCREEMEGGREPWAKRVEEKAAKDRDKASRPAVE